MEIRALNASGLTFLANEEGGFILHPYLDSVKIPTISAGCTYYPETGIKIRMSDPHISLDRARSMFALMVKNYELAVYSSTRDDINQNQFNALVSICYNIGVGGFKRSNLLKYVNNDPNDFANIKKGFLGWSKAGTDLTILRGRRLREFNLYCKPIVVI